ncbi:hypothetical protein [Dickeya oryzae]|uniref:Uncharacterized protein n=1 Tax=Dickeya oryzae TaxID=1240404 RepID=A0AB39IDD3_9GAMM|nr:hypothetical protein [Dickeya oryzae]MCA6996538.1 hypothetical protein [Dickeya oryzae]
MNLLTLASRIVVLGFVCLVGVTQADDDFPVYRGTIGNTTIVMELYNAPGQPENQSINGRYFYTKYRKDIGLSGSQDVQGNLVLSEGDDSMDEQQALAGKDPIPVMVLRSRDQNTLQGEWRNGKGKSYPVVLSLVTELPATASPFMQQAYQHSRYEYLRHERAEPVMTKQETVNGYDVEWWRDPLSGMTTFQLRSGYPVEQLSGLNTVLRKELWQEVLNYYRCMQGTDKGSYTEQVNINQLLPWVVSYSIAGSESCGNGYNSGVRSESLYASDASHMELKDFFWVGEQPAPDNTLEPKDYSDGILPHWLAEQFSVMYPERMANTVNSGGGNTLCDYRRSEVWVFPTWSLTAQGILFHPTFPTSDSVCDDAPWAIVPWSVVKQHPGRLKNLPLP